MSFGQDLKMVMTSIIGLENCEISKCKGFGLLVVGNSIPSKLKVNIWKCRFKSNDGDAAICLDGLQEYNQKA